MWRLVPFAIILLCSTHCSDAARIRYGFGLVFFDFSQLTVSFLRPGVVVAFVGNASSIPSGWFASFFSRFCVLL